MDQLLRIALGVGKTTPANPSANMQELLHIAEHLPEATDLLLLPTYALTSSSIGSLAGQELVLETSSQELHALRQWTHSTPTTVIVGYTKRINGQVCSVVAVLQKGRIVTEMQTTMATPLYFTVNSTIVALVPHLQDPAWAVAQAVRAGASLCLLTDYCPIVAGQTAKQVALLRALSRTYQIAIGVVNGGIGDTSSPYFYQGMYALYESGTELLFETGHTSGILGVMDLDCTILVSNRHTPYTPPETTSFHITTTPKQTCLRTIPQNPFLPQDPTEREDYIAELFAFQVQSLVTRMQHTGIFRLVVGVSGGIDSTAALLVAVSACEALGLPRSAVHGITLPGLGTSDNTYFNALALLEALEVTRQDISIRPAILQHFEDLGHSGNPDLTYENAQARERTQILLDIANMVGGLVVGTGDLSEEALGFCTFGGDHLANYNVNVCLTKEMLREELAYLCGTPSFHAVAALLGQVLETPVSPELLPPDEEGSIRQKTEEILGSYRLHDFFLYYFVHYQMRPSRILEYAVLAFGEDFSKQKILETLRLFLTRFCRGQFKRACAPDAAAITSVNLLGVQYHIPSDLNISLLLADLEAL